MLLNCLTIEAGPHVHSTAKFWLMRSDELLTLQLRPGKIDAVEGRFHDGPGVQIIIVDELDNGAIQFPSLVSCSD